MNVNLKQMNFSHEKILSGYKFKIRPFPAFTAMNMSGEVISFLSPLFTALGPLLSQKDAANASISIPANTAIMSGEKVESIMQKLLVDNSNITVEIDGKPESLSRDLANEVFCGQAQDMYILAYEVVAINFPGIFGKLSSLFGKAGELMAQNTILANMVNLTPDNSNLSN